MKPFISHLILMALLLCNNILKANQVIDSLEQLLVSSNDSMKYRIYIQLHNQTFYLDEKLTHKYIDKAIDIAGKNSWTLLQMDAIMAKGIVFYNYNQYDSAITRYRFILDKYKTANDTFRLARAYGNLGNCYMNKAQLDSALIYFKITETLFSQLGNVKGKARVNGVIGVLYMHLKQYDKAEPYFEESYRLSDSIGNMDDAVTSRLNLAIIYKHSGNYEKAIEIDKFCIDYYSKHSNPYYQAMAQTNMAECYHHTGRYNEAELNYLQATKIYIELKQYLGAVKNYSYLSQSNYLIKQYPKALHYLELALPYMDSINDPDVKMTIYEEFSKNYKITGNYKSALEYHELFYAIYDSTQELSRQSKIDSLLTQFESEKLSNQIATQQKTIKNEKKLRMLMQILIVLFIAFIIVLYRQYRIKKRTNSNLNLLNKQISQQNEEIINQRDEIEVQRDHIARQNIQMRSGIHYASTIQNAIMPSLEGLRKILPQSFVFAQPLDQVGGDFFFYHVVNGKIIIAVVDCSGHGVPGAFLSLLGISFFNEISKSGITKADLILEKMRELTISTFINRSGHLGDHESMVASVLVIDQANQQFEFSAAQGRVLFYHQNEPILLKSGNLLIGNNIKQSSFESKVYNYQNGDQLYLFTDGFIDQYGGSENTKYSTHRFCNLIIENIGRPMVQKDIIFADAFNTWKQTSEQIDDVLVLGIKL